MLFLKELNYSYRILRRSEISFLALTLLKSSFVSRQLYHFAACSIPEFFLKGGGGVVRRG